MDILKAQQFKIQSNSIELNVNLISRNGETYIRNYDSEYEYVYPKIKLIELANLLLPWYKSHASDKFLSEDMSFYIHGKLSYNEDQDKYFLLTNGVQIELQYEDLFKLCNIILLDKFILYDFSQYIELSEEYMRNKIREIEIRLGLNNLDLTPQMDFFYEWFIDHFKLGKLDKSYSYPNKVSWLFNFTQELSREISNGQFYGGGYNEFLNEVAGRSIFNPGYQDEFGRSPFSHLANKLSSELVNEAFEGIPSYGPASNMSSELISNLNYILYRYYNDGDLAEDILKDPNCVPMINVVNYLSDLGTEDLLIFTRFYYLAISIVHNYANRVNYTEITLDQLIKKAKDEEPQMYYSSLIPKELIERIDKGDFKLNSDEYYDRVDLYNSSYCEFMLNEAVIILIALACLLKTYPDWLKGEKVYDLRHKLYSKY